MWYKGQVSAEPDAPRVVMTREYSPANDLSARMIGVTRMPLDVRSMSMSHESRALILCATTGAGAGARSSAVGATCGGMIGGALSGSGAYAGGASKEFT